MSIVKHHLAFVVSLKKKKKMEENGTASKIESWLGGVYVKILKTTNG